MPCCDCGHVARTLRLDDLSASTSSGGGEGAKSDKHFRHLSTLPNYAEENECEVTHIDAAVVFDLNARSMAIDVSIKLDVRAVRDRTFQLNGVAFEFSSVDLKAEKGGAPISIEHRYDGKKLTVVYTADSGVAAGDTLVLHAVYKVDDPVSGMVFSTNVKEDSPRFACADHETDRARYWLLCQDEPQVRPQYRFDLSVSNKELEGVTGYANGVRKVEQEQPGHFVYECDFPTPSYLVCIGIGQYRQVTAPKEVLEGLGDIDITYIAPRDVTDERLKRSFAVTPMAMRWLSKKVGQPFPFPAKFHQIIVPFIGGAMECVTFVTYDSLFDMDEVLARDWQHLCDLVIVHEMSHSYFGDSLVMKYFEHAWLKESWATYMMSCFLEDNGLPDSVEVNSNKYEDFKADLYDNAQRYFAESREAYVRPIVTREYDHSWKMFDRHLYPGGGWRLHMLRRMLGDDTFWQGVKNYVGKFAKGLVETIDFQRELEAVSNRNLHRFFDQWLHRAGHPIVEMKLSYDISKGKVELRGEQVQKKKNEAEPKQYDHDWVEVFDIDVPVEVTVVKEGGERRKEMHTLSFASNKGANATCSITLPPNSKLGHVEIDPDFFVLLDWAWKESPGSDILNSVLTSGRCFANQVAATKAMLEHHGVMGVKKVAAALKGVGNYLGRGLVAKELISTSHPLAISAVVDAAKAEQHNLAAVHITSALSSLSNPLRVADIEHLIDNSAKRDNYLSRLNLFEALGGCAKYAGKEVRARVMARCEAELPRDGHHGMLALAGARGLAAMGGEAAAEAIKPFMEKGVLSDYGRRGAISAFGRAAGQATERSYRQAAAAHLAAGPIFDDVEAIRRAALGALASVGESSFATVIENAKGTIAEQHYARELLVHIRKLRKASAGEDQAERIGKMIESVEKKLGEKGEKEEKEEK